MKITICTVFLFALLHCKSNRTDGSMAVKSSPEEQLQDPSHFICRDIEKKWAFQVTQQLAQVDGPEEHFVSRLVRLDGADLGPAPAEYHCTKGKKATECCDIPNELWVCNAVQDPTIKANVFEGGFAGSTWFEAKFAEGASKRGPFASFTCVKQN